MKKSLLFLLLLSCVALLASCASSTSSASPGTSPTETPVVSPSEDVDATVEPEVTDDASTPAAEGGNDTVNMTETKILSDKVSLLIPDSFDIMSEEMAVIKYPTEPRPSIIYTDETGAINVAFNYTESPAASEEVTTYLDAVAESLVGAYPDAEWYTSEMITINEMELGVMEFVTPAADTAIYNLMWLSSVDGQLLISTFNCTLEQMDQWVPIAGEILSSFQLVG